MTVKIAVALLFYLFYWFCCFLCTGTDEKNLAGLRSYPDADKHIGSFLRGIPMFAVVAVISSATVTVV